MHAHEHRAHSKVSLDRVALSATVHCLTGCAIGEVLGMVIGTALYWDNVSTIALAVVLAFGFGYALTIVALLWHGIAFFKARDAVNTGGGLQGASRFSGSMIP